MTDEEYKKLKIGDYIYRLSDGHIGKLTSAPYSPSPDELIKENITYSLDIGYSDYSGKANFNSSDRKNWAIFDWRTCTNPMALTKYSIILNFEIIKALQSTTIL